MSYRHLDIIQRIKIHVNVSSKLWEDWKKGDHCMGKNIRKYEPTPEEVPDQHKLSDFQFKLVQVECTNPKAKDFAAKYKVNLPSSIRSRYLASKFMAYRYHSQFSLNMNCSKSVGVL